MSQRDTDALEHEFDLMMARSGVAVPPERRSGTLAGYGELKRMIQLLRQPRGAESEPSNVFLMDVILRST